MKGLYRGFCRDENGNETIVLNGEEIKGVWLEGSLIKTIYENVKGERTSYYRILYGIIDIDEEGFPGFLCGSDEEVIPETICEAVRGAKDKKGKQIYEGDILCDESKTKYQIYYCDEENAWRLIALRKTKPRPIEFVLQAGDEVIGTIFDKEAK